MPDRQRRTHARDAAVRYRRMVCLRDRPRPRVRHRTRLPGLPQGAPARARRGNAPAAGNADEAEPRGSSGDMVDARARKAILRRRDALLALPAAAGKPPRPLTQASSLSRLDPPRSADDEALRASMPSTSLAITATRSSSSAGRPGPRRTRRACGSNCNQRGSGRPSPQQARRCSTSPGSASRNAVGGDRVKERLPGRVVQVGDRVARFRRHVDDVLQRLPAEAAADRDGKRDPREREQQVQQRELRRLPVQQVEAGDRRPAPAPGRRSARRTCRWPSCRRTSQSRSTGRNSACRVVFISE